jgi:hypothetical protein
MYSIGMHRTDATSWKNIAGALAATSVGYDTFLTYLDTGQDTLVQMDLDTGKENI